MAETQRGPGSRRRHPWHDYEENLDAKLVELHTHIHRGSYHPLPSRRKYIANADGRKRPLGVAALEDKIVQRAVVEVLNAIYEQDFRGVSYAFRPGRGQHDALDALAVGITQRKVNWILDADLASFFGSILHAELMRSLARRIVDRRVLHLIKMWLECAVEETDDRGRKKRTTEASTRRIGRSTATRRRG